MKPLLTVLVDSFLLPQVFIVFTSFHLIRIIKPRVVISPIAGYNSPFVVALNKEAMLNMPKAVELFDLP